jgi:hypothetical protein
VIVPPEMAVAPACGFATETSCNGAANTAGIMILMNTKERIAVARSEIDNVCRYRVAHRQNAGLSDTGRFGLSHLVVQSGAHLQYLVLFPILSLFACNVSRIPLIAHFLRGDNRQRCVCRAFESRSMNRTNAESRTLLLSNSKFISLAGRSARDERRGCGDKRQESLGRRNAQRQINADLGSVFIAGKH